MRKIIIDTIGDNTLKGSVWAAAMKEKIPLEMAIKDHLVFHYKTYNPNLPPDHFAEDICWLYDNGAKKVEIKELV